MGTYPFLFLQIFFGIITYATITLFINACGSNKKAVTLILLFWLTLQGILTYYGFYQNTSTVPPRFIFLLGPTILVILLLFLTRKGKNFIEHLNPATLTWLHTIRIPVELVLFWLYEFNLVPELMTFEGRNFDILSGITAPFIGYYGYVKHKISRPVLLIWNFICLGLLINIVTHAILSAPSPFQQLAFDQPNIAILTFPFSWLACCIVPIVFLSHFVCIHDLLRNKR